MVLGLREGPGFLALRKNQHNEVTNLNKFIMSSLWKSANGDVSSKRIAGLVCLAIGLIMALADQFTIFAANYNILKVVFGTGGGLLGIGLVELFGKNKLTDVPPKAEL